MKKIGVSLDNPCNWTLCAVGMMIAVASSGFLNIFGVFFVEFRKDFNATMSQISWIGSTTYGLNLLASPISGKIRLWAGDKIVIVSSCLLCAVSLLATSFVYQWQIMFLTFTLLFGTGYSMMYMSIQNIPTKYFQKHIEMATGFVASGGSTGTLVLPYITQVIIDKLGWRNTWRLFMGIFIMLAPTALLFRTPKVDMGSVATNNDIFSPTVPLRKNLVYNLWVVAFSLMMLGYSIPYVYLVSYAISCGLTARQGASLMTVIGGVSTFGRIVWGKVMNYGILNRLHLSQFAMLFTGTAIVMLPLLRTYPWLIFFSVIIGLVDSCHWVLLPILTSYFAGSNKLTMALGILYCSCSVTYTLGSPLTGWLYEITGSYSIPFHVCGIPILLATAVLFLMPWAQRTVCYKKDGHFYNKFPPAYPEIEFGEVNPTLNSKNLDFHDVETRAEVVYNQETEITILAGNDMTRNIYSPDNMQIQCNQDDHFSNNEYNCIIQNYSENPEPSSTPVMESHSSLGPSAVNCCGYDTNPSQVIIPDSVVEVLENLAKNDNEQRENVEVISRNTICPSSQASSNTDLSRKRQYSEHSTNFYDDDKYSSQKDVGSSNFTEIFSHVSLSKEQIRDQVIFQNMDLNTEDVSEPIKLIQAHDEYDSYSDLKQTLSGQRVVIPDSVVESLQLLATGNESVQSNVENILVDVTYANENLQKENTEPSLLSLINFQQQLPNQKEEEKPLYTTENMEILRNIEDQLQSNDNIDIDQFEPRSAPEENSFKPFSCIDENLLFSPPCVVEVDQNDTSNFEDENSKSMDISALAAENLAKFVEDVGIAPKNTESNCTSERDDKLLTMAETLPYIKNDTPFPDNSIQPIVSDSQNIMSDVRVINTFSAHVNSEFNCTIPSSGASFTIPDESRKESSNIVEYRSNTDHREGLANAVDALHINLCTNPFVMADFDKTNPQHMVNNPVSGEYINTNAGVDTQIVLDQTTSNKTGFEIFQSETFLHNGTSEEFTVSCNNTNSDFPYPTFNLDPNSQQSDLIYAANDVHSANNVDFFPNSFKYPENVLNPNKSMDNVETNNIPTSYLQYPLACGLAPDANIINNDDSADYSFKPTLDSDTYTEECRMTPDPKSHDYNFYSVIDNSQFSQNLESCSTPYGVCPASVDINSGDKLETDIESALEHVQIKVEEELDAFTQSFNDK